MKQLLNYTTLLAILLLGITTAMACSTGEAVEENTQPKTDEDNKVKNKWEDATYMAKFVTQKQAVILDLTARNGEDETSIRNLYSAKYIFEVAGIVGSTTSSLDDALSNSDFILLSSTVNDNTFTGDELTKIQTWIKNGGTIIAPAVSGSSAAALFGVSVGAKAKTRNTLRWNTTSGANELQYFDEAEEKEMCIGNIYTYSYSITSAGTALASFDDGTAAVVKSSCGDGNAYTFPFQWCDLIQRAQLNKSSSASRVYNNGFEPTADCAPLFVRQAYTLSHPPVAAWKHTIPAGQESVFIPTHDIDSTTGYDSLFYMARYETEVGVKGHYNITTKYFRDKISKAYYIDRTKDTVKQELVGKHTIGSHSVGHFPDMNNDSRFPMGSFSITKDEYNPYNDGTQTTGGYTYAEVAISKSLLEQDFGIEVNSFRSGHLCMNKQIDEAMQHAGIDYASCWTAAGLMSEFPFMERTGLSYEGDEAVLEMPMHTSDVSFPDKVKIDITNYKERADIWLTVANKLRGNYAPCIILIHPNREWKMLAEKHLIDNLDRTRTGLYNFIDYGDFWTNRRAFTYTLAVNSDDGNVLITVPTSAFETAHDLGIVITGNAALTADNIRVVDENRNYRSFTLKKLGDAVCIVF